MNIASQRHILVRTKAKFDESFFRYKTAYKYLFEGRRKKNKQKQNICIHITNTYINVECTFILKKQANCLL